MTKVKEEDTYLGTPNLVHIYLAAIKIDLETVASIMISNKTCVRNIQSVHFKVKC